MATFAIGSTTNILSHGYLTFASVDTLASTDPMRSKIRAAAIWGINNRITQALGYYNNRIWAYDPPRTFEQMTEFPSVNVFWESEECNTAADLKLEPGNGLMQIQAILHFEAVTNDANDPSLARDKLLADLQKYFGHYYWVPDSGGTATCHEIYYISCDPFGVERTVPLVGVDVRFRVWYRQQRTDPTLSA